MKNTVTLALLCDTHLPLLKKTPAYTVFDKAVSQTAGADYIFTLGDITAHGNRNAMEHFIKKMDGTGIPWAAVPGNAERRDPEMTEELLAALDTPLFREPLRLKEAGWTVVLLDCSDCWYPDIEREKLQKAIDGLGEKEHLLVLQHQGPCDLGKESQEFLKAVLSPVADRCLIVYGHKHRFGNELWEGFATLRLQALDPDKAIGTEPLFIMMQLSPEEQSFDVYGFSHWTDRDVDEVISRLGLSCFHLPKDLDHAIENGVKAIELRHGTMLDLPEEELLEKIAAWRAAGGKYLSLHATEPGRKNGRIVRAEEWLDSARWAKKIGADAITLHVPKAPVETMKRRTASRKEMKELYLKGLALLGEECDIHIENMHMADGEDPGDTRRFGYLPREVKGWIEELRKEFPRPEKISFLLDVGHARNNAPFSSVYTMGMWYAMMGKMTDACHMHQVLNENGVMKNHQPITDIYGPLINFGGFLTAWNKKLLRPRTIFLEVRSLENYLISIDTWKNFRG